MHIQTKSQNQKYNGAQKSQPPRKNMQGLSTAFFLAKKVGEKLGRSDVLQRQMQGNEKFQ